MIDSRDLGTSGGFDIRAHLEPDPEITPMTHGDYGDDDIAAWRNGYWSYVTVVVTASKDDVELGRSSLGGCEYGWFPGMENHVNPLGGDGADLCNGYGAGLIAEAVAAATEAQSQISS